MNASERIIKQLMEVAPPGMEGTVKALKKNPEIDNPLKVAWAIYNKKHKTKRGK